MVFVVDDLLAWLVGLIADAGRKKLITRVLGTDQDRALRRAVEVAVEATAAELAPSGAPPPVPSPVPATGWHGSWPTI